MLAVDSQPLENLNVVIFCSQKLRILFFELKLPQPNSEIGQLNILSPTKVKPFSSVFEVGITVKSTCIFFVASRHHCANVVSNVSNSLSKGLNFSVHGDAAWGGYFCSMMRDEHRGAKMVATGFVPEMYLSTYVSKQLSMLKHCDTITIDPHKSGFCPYPAGAICYRDKTMNSFLQITTGAVYYHGDMTLGDIGIEGSKSGAAAAGVMLANRVMLTIKGFWG